MNRVKIGREFEKEAFEILKEQFDKVEWLSKKKKSTFDFKCIKNNKIYFGDAKMKSDSKQIGLSNKQKEADFIIAKVNNEIQFFWNKDFKDRVYIYKKDMTTINVEQKILNEFEKDRMEFRMKQKGYINQDKFTKELLICWRMGKK